MSWECSFQRQYSTLVKKQEKVMEVNSLELADGLRQFFNFNLAS